MKTDFDLTPYFNRWSIENYQAHCRIYLDEYPEQNLLRYEWAEKNHDAFQHIYTRFLWRE